MYTLSVLRAWPNPQHLVCSDAIRGSRLLGHPELNVQVLSVSSHIRLTDDITTAFSRLTEGENVAGWVFCFLMETGRMPEGCLSLQVGCESGGSPLCFTG